MDPIVMPDIDLKTAPFDKICYQMEDSDPHIAVFHMHDGLEIGHIIRGSGHIIVENSIYGFEPDAITLLNGRLSHCLRPDDRANYCRNKIHFSSQYMLPILKAMGQADLLSPFFSADRQHAVLQLSAETSDKINRLFQEMQSELDARELDYLPAITARLIQILILVNRNAQRGKIHHPPNALFQHAFQVIEYASGHLETFSLDELSKELFLSKYYLCHCFKKATGTTIWQYVLDKKIDRAKELLKHTNLPVSQVAMDLGFSSFSLFSRSFKRLTGHAPTAFRKGG